MKCKFGEFFLPGSERAAESSFSILRRFEKSEVILIGEDQMRHWECDVEPRDRNSASMARTPRGFHGKES